MDKNCFITGNIPPKKRFGAVVIILFIDIFPFAFDLVSTLSVLFLSHSGNNNSVDKYAYIAPAESDEEIGLMEVNLNVSGSLIYDIRKTVNIALLFETNGS